MNFPTLHRWAGAAVLAATAMASTLAPATASALTFSDLVIFGDSLSDTGNLSLATGGAAPGMSQPYYQGRFSDGLIWTDYLAQGLGQAGDAKSYMLGGNNYAFAGARTGGTAGGIPGVLSQTFGIWGSTHAYADPNALYVVVAGGNDLRDSRSNPLGTATTRQQDAEFAIDNLKSSLSFLAMKGAKHVLVSTMPDLGDSFEAVVLGKTLESRDATLRFNALVAGLESYGDRWGMDVDVLDMYGVAKSVRANPAAYGITNVGLPCAGFLGSNAFGSATACSQSLFSDALHPSSRGHQIIAAAAFDALGVTPVPEPETYAMLLAGLAMIGAVARRRTQKQAA